MEFCIISPTAGLEKYAGLSKTHLVLAHECGTGTYETGTHRQFYKERKRQGDFIILDNGGYEGKPFWDPFLIESLKPDVVVLPDFYLKPWQQTWHAAIATLNAWHDELIHKPAWCYIPQAERGDLHGFMQSYLEAASDPRITWLGIPRCLATDIARDPLARVNFARVVKRDHPGMRLHAFGMVNGDIHELPYLAAAGVDSVDSSAPVWRGWHQIDIQQYLPEGFPPVDFGAEWDPLTDCIIKSNLEACGVRIPTRE